MIQSNGGTRSLRVAGVDRLEVSVVGFKVTVLSGPNQGMIFPQAAAAILGTDSPATSCSPTGRSRGGTWR